jgi:hypothetical protein
MSTSSTYFNFLELTFRRAAVVWWALVWRQALLSGCVFLMFLFLPGFIRAVAGASPSIALYLTLFSGVAGLAVGVTTGIYVVQVALRQTYSEFTIRLVPRQSGESNY